MLLLRRGSDAPQMAGLPRPNRLRTSLLVVLGLVVAAFSYRASDSPEALAALLGLVPAAVALRYGFVFAATAVSATVSTVALMATPSALVLLIPPMAAPFALALLMGHLRDREERTQLALEGLVDEQAQTLWTLQRRHQALIASHHRLEAQIAAQATALDASLREAARLMEAHAAIARAAVPSPEPKADEAASTLYGLPPPIKALAWIEREAKRQVL